MQSHVSQLQSHTHLDRMHITHTVTVGVTLTQRVTLSLTHHTDEWLATGYSRDGWRSWSEWKGGLVGEWGQTV